MMSEDMSERISLPAQDSGRSPPTWPDGRKVGNSGPAHALVSRFRSRDSGKAMSTNDTSGPLFSASSPSAAHQISLANRLRARMDLNGSPECALTWKALDMPAGVQICQLVASERRTGDTGCSGPPSAWPTPQHREAGGGDYSSPEKAQARLASGHQVNLQDHMTAAQWPTPNTPSGGRTMTFEEAMTQRKRKDGSKAQLNLENAIVHLASPRATPTARDWKSGEASAATMDRNARPLNEQMVHFGPAPSGSNAPMAKRGAHLVPNPFFAAWLMGFPPSLMASILRVCSSLPSRAERKHGKSPETP